MSTTNQEPAGMADVRRGDGGCQVAVFYDETAARDRAVALSHRLVEHFWEELDFSFSWWRLRYLGDASIAAAAAAAAVSADVLVFSVDAAGSPGAGVMRWMCSWAPQRAGDLGVVVPLLHPSTAEAMSDSAWMVEIEELARETGLECLLPSELRQSPMLEEPLRQMELRARHIGGVLGGIMGEGGTSESRPPGWGLNE